MTVFGNPSVKFDVFDAQVKLRHLRKLHRMVEDSLLNFPFKEIDKTVSTLTSETWDEPVESQTRSDLMASNLIEAKVLTRFHRQSALSVSYAVFEFALLELVGNYVRYRGVEEKLNVRERGLRKIMRVFAEAGHALSTFREPDWIECLNIADVRNKVMHNGGLIGLSERSKFSGFRGISFEEFGGGDHLLQICIDRNSIFRMFQMFDDLLEMMNNEVDGILNADP